MNLTKANISDLKKVTVKIVCSNCDEGSGTVLSVGEMYYVLTAAHIIENETEDGPKEKDHIFVKLTRNSQDYDLKVVEIVFYERAIDAAILRISIPINMPTTGLNKVRLLTTSVNGPGELCGFHRGEYTPKHYAFENRSATTWAVMNIQLKVQGINPIENFSGTSGGGIFYADTARNLYLAAFMSELTRYDGNNNEFTCLPSSYFLSSGLLGEVADNRQYEYIADSGVATNVDGKQLINPLDKSDYDKNQRGVFLENERTREIINQLLDDEESTILLTALSGMGKTKIIYEAFKGTERMPNRFYAKYGDGRDQLLGEMAQILRKNYDSDGIIIIDDCPMDLVPEVISTRDNLNHQFRLILVNHDYFNEALTHSAFTVIKLSPKEMEDRVNLYISTELSENDVNRNDVIEIKKLAGGYPQMAIELVKNYQEEDTVGPAAVEHLMPKLLSLTAGQEKEEKTIWQTFSLCLPFPYKDATHQGFEYMIKENHFTPLNGMEYEDRRSIAARLVDKYSPTLIDKQGMWLYVRPFPLAVWLTAEWFKNVCNTPIHFKELIDSVKRQPEWVQNTISEGFCKHIQQMSGNKEAFKMVEKLVNAELSHPFFDEENLSSGLGSKLLLAMSTVNPAAIAASLKRVLGSKELTWLKEKFDGDGRRNVVWALERLCFAHESYNDGIAVLARLAAAENEDFGNNASGQLAQLFHISLAGTEVSLSARLETLKQLVKEGGEYIAVVVRCFDSAFRNGGYSKMGGAEKFGFDNRKDYTPGTWGEVYEYWNGCRDLLLKWMTENPAMVDALAGMVEENVFNWARGGQKSILVPLMEKIAEIKGYQWDSGYDALAKTVYTFGINESALGVNKLMEQLRTNSFISELKDARYKLNGKYHLGEKEQIDLTDGLFGHLAVVFLKQSVYANSYEVEFLLEDTDYIPFQFLRKVVFDANDEQLEEFFNTVFKVIMTKTEDFSSPFLRNLAYEARDRAPLMHFLDKLEKAGREFLYVSLMGGTEDGDLGHFKRLLAEEKDGILKHDFLPVYLQFFRSYGDERYLMMLSALRDNYPNRPNDLIAYVVSERFMIQKDELPEAIAIIKQALLDYQIDEDYGRLLGDYSRILIETLQLWHDDEFAKKVNQKMIGVYNTKMVHLSMDGIFTVLLKEYFDVVWPDFVSAFLGEETFLFYYQVKDELGSGFGFGKGPLFDVNEDLIKRLCLDNPKSAPVRIAAMAPCFEIDENGQETGRFSKWLIWLLDQFGEQKDVLSSISGNLGSFTWSGDVSPYYERNIKCFENLLSHPKTEVREWAKLCIEDERKMMEIEKNDEVFRKIRYEL